MRTTTRWRRAGCAVGLSFALTAGLLSTTGAPFATAHRSPIPVVTGNSRVDKLLSQMTLDEMLTLLQGVPVAQSDLNQNQAGYLPGIPRLGVPALTFADGPPGVVTRQDSTGMVSTMGLAATFNTDRAAADGRVIGTDADALGQDVVLEPFVNLDRDTSGSRTWNTFGEDPYLSARMGAAQIQGIQSTGTMAQVKHYVGYDGSSIVIVDEQTLHELYLAPFDSAVDAGVSCVMCAYGVVNSTTNSACGDSYLLTTVLRGEMGFKGFVTSDWGGTHATINLAAGLDMEMPGGLADPGGNPTSFTKSAITSAIAAGTVTVAQVRQAAGRILFMYDRFGLLKNAPKHTVTPEDRATDNAVVQRTAEQAAVLLKNDGVLPLSARGTTALIGPGAGQTIATYGVGEKSGGIVSEQIGTYQVLKQLGANVTYAVADDLTGSAVPASALTHDGQPGLVRTGSGATTVDAQVWFTAARGNALPAGSENTWTGTLRAPETGSYWVNLGLLGGNGSLQIDGVTVARGSARYGRLHAAEGNGPLPTTDGLANYRGQVTLTAGDHRISITQTKDVSAEPVQVRLSWVTPTQQRANHDSAVQAAKKARTAVVFAWSNPELDLSAPLPEGQDQLIADVAAVNANTIVVLNTSQPVAMPWLKNVKAVVEMWYPGDRGGYATANVLLGKVNPAGKLPFTWPVSIDQELAHQSSHPERNSAGLGSACGFPTQIQTPWLCPATTYSEGVNIGYRFFAATGETPLFPFGYGLSYGESVTYSKLKVHPAPDGGLTVSVRVSNSGSQDVDAVPQVYLAAPTTAPAGVQFAPTALAGFDRVTVRAHHSTTVRIQVPLRQLQYWSSASDRWVTATGSRGLSVNTDATHPVLTTTVRIGH